MAYYKIENMDNCLTVRDMVLRSGEVFSERDAYRFERQGVDCAVSFKQFAEDYRGLCVYLAQKCSAGSHIGICAGNSYEWILSYTAAMDIGVAVPISVETDSKEMEYLCSKADITADIAHNEQFGLFGDGVEILDISQMQKYIDEGKALISQGAQMPPAKDEKALCEILFTSGTTGAKRGVMLSSANIMSIVKSSFPNLIGSLTLSALPFSHGFEAVCHILASLNPGVTVCIAKSNLRYGYEMVKYQPQSIYLVPMQAAGLLTVFSALFEKCKGNLKTIVCGGAAINAGLYEGFAAAGIRLLAGYGLSECSPLVSLNTDGTVGSAGKAAPYCKVRISEGGLIEVKGDNVMEGYYKDEKATKAAFTPDGWLITGDLGRLTEQGDIFITGRVKNLIILPNGENIIPEEVEEVLSRYLPGGSDFIVLEDEEKLAVQLYVGEMTEQEALAVLKKAVDEANTVLPTFKRISKTLIRNTPYEKTALGKIKREIK